MGVGSRAADLLNKQTTMGKEICHAEVPGAKDPSARLTPSFSLHLPPVAGTCPSLHSTWLRVLVQMPRETTH